MPTTTPRRLGVCRRAVPRAYILGVFGMCGFVGRLLCGCCDLVAGWEKRLPGLRWLLTEVYVPPQGASVPESRSLSWSFTLCGVVVVAGSCLPRFRGRQEFVMGSLWAHGGSTTFPWVPSRPVQLGYDRVLRGT